ncbi:WD repeat-containing protein on Y chromosome [Nephila pilipes]|uniref:WD repeat-containing protein on Y chromosome n=1 Tax=Nephila pilipes TaxID=299642 RepID=A0A8X6T8U9_NEPPI|nr:WD repeat-containing protein on Y chromosome [Nephila pilipes]
MLIHHVERDKSLSFSAEGGITCFDFCEKLNCVATGCIDSSIKIWNPIENIKCSEALTGHFNSVTHIIVDEKRLYVISADRDKIIRIWNLLTPVCLQVLRFKESDFSERQIFASLYLDQEYDKLIITTNRIAVISACRKEIRKVAHPDSELVIFVGYSSVFECFITIGNKASVVMWDAESFSLIHEFTEIHITSNKEGITQIVDVSAAGFDPSERRLVTAARNGSIKVWNFHLGICLREFKAKFSVLALTFVDFNIFAAGSSGSISTFYDDGEVTAEGIEWKPLHKQAIISADTCSQHLLASASSHGEIIVWLWKNADAKLRAKENIESRIF